MIENDTRILQHVLLCRPAHVDSRGRSVGSFGDGEVHPDPTTIQLHTIGPILCLAVNIYINKPPLTSEYL